jgi:hypothetical protein
MEHSEAIQLHAVEKYVLGELSEKLRDDFEEHFFDCVECAHDVKAATTFAGASRETFRGDTPEKLKGKTAAQMSRGWLDRLRPKVVVPALAALSAIILYQNAVTIPGTRRGTSQDAARVFDSSFQLRGNARGENQSTVKIRSKESFALDLDFTPSQVFETYTGQLLDEAGNLILQISLTREQINKEVHAVIAGGILRPGRYSLLIRGNPKASDQAKKNNEVQRFAFVVEFVN